MKKTYWIVTIENDSGDKYRPLLFVRKPTNEKLRKVCKKLYPEDFEFEEGEGPGDWGSMLFTELYEETAED